VGIRTAVKNQLHALAMNQGLCRRSKLWSTRGRLELETLELGLWAGRRRQELLKMLVGLEESVTELDRAVEKEAHDRAVVVGLMSHPGVGPVVASLCPDHWSGRAFPAQQAGRQLPWVEPTRALQRRTPTLRFDQ